MPLALRCAATNAQWWYVLGPRIARARASSRGFPCGSARSFGPNVYSTEVENALYEHPAVLECAAYGVPSAKWGEEVRAAVVLSADATAEPRSCHVP